MLKKALIGLWQRINKIMMFISSNATNATSYSLSKIKNDKKNLLLFYNLYGSTFLFMQYKTKKRFR